jgi:hypothetical protein
MEDLLKLQFRLGRDGLQPALEMSKRGRHLWTVFLQSRFWRDSAVSTFMTLHCADSASGELRIAGNNLPQRGQRREYAFALARYRKLQARL